MPWLTDVSVEISTAISLSVKCLHSEINLNDKFLPGNTKVIVNVLSRYVISTFCTYFY